MGRAKVLSLLVGQRVDPLPRGEVWVTPAVLESEGLPNDATGVAELAAKLGADLCFFSCGGPQAVPNRPEALREGVAEAHARDLACGILVDGPWQRQAQEQGLLALLGQVGSREGRLSEQLAAQSALVHDELRAWAQAGADLFLLADDLAYSQGPYFAPSRFARLLLPLYHQFLRNAADLRVPLGFHSDGDMTPLLPPLVDAGFSFLSLEPEAMDLVGVARLHGDRVALMSGIPSAWLCQGRFGGGADQLSVEISSLARACRVILASSCGLFEIASPAALTEVYRIADRLNLASAPDRD